MPGDPEAISAQGTLIARAPAASPAAFVTIGELRDITPPPLSRNPIETTSHNGEEESFVVGIRRKGELGFQVGYVPGGGVDTNHDLLEQSWTDGSRDIWKVTYPNAAIWLFSGYLVNLGPSCPVDDGLVADVSVRPTGVMTITNPA
jgi:hypothetical protein